MHRSVSFTDAAGLGGKTADSTVDSNSCMPLGAPSRIPIVCET